MAGVYAPNKKSLSTDEAGQRLRKARERLGLKFREVEVASQKIAERHANEEYSIGLSRLSEIENKAVVPSVFRLYSLSTIYGVDFREILSWYRVDLNEQSNDAKLQDFEQTRPSNFLPKGFSEVIAPFNVDLSLEASLDPSLDLKQTTFLSRVSPTPDALPIRGRKVVDSNRKRYAVIGTDDWSMHPILRPGSLLLINDSSRIANSGWNDEWDRPIYFLKHDDSYFCGWCHLDGNRLVILSHPSSAVAPKIYLYPEEIEILGQIVGIALSIDSTCRQRVQPLNAHC